MTSTVLSTQTNEAPGATRRLVNVVRLHLVNRSQIIFTPWLIMSFIFAVSLMIGWIFRSASGAGASGEQTFTMEFNGAVFYFMVYMLVLAVMAISQVFPFAQSYSVTRRDFYIGTVLTFFSLSLAYSVVITLLGWIEDSTNGWGIDISVFNPGIFGTSMLERFYITMVLFIFFLMTGMATASVYVRWKANGMYAFFGSLALIILGLVWLATITDSWTAVGAWFQSMGFIGVVTWTLVPSFLSIVTGYLFLSKATPRN